MGRVSKRTSAPAVADKKTRTCYKAGIYARLSSDQDRKKNESVEVQVKIAEKDRDHRPLYRPGEDGE